MGKLTQPDISASGLLLRAWQPFDRSVVVAAYADPSIQRWHCRSMTDIEAAEWIDSWALRWRGETDASWAVVDADSVVGQVGLRHIDLAEGVAAVSYWVVPAARGRRIAPRALAALTVWSFGTLGLHRLQLSHSTMNEPSCRVARHAGFKADAVPRAYSGHGSTGY